jgi:hypothetical protein
MRNLKLSALDPLFGSQVTRVLKRWGSFLSVRKGLITKEEWQAMSPIYGWDWFQDPDHRKGLNRFLLSVLGSLCLTVALGWNRELQWIVLPLTVVVCIAHSIGWCWWVYDDSLKLRSGILSRIIPFLDLRTEEERAYAEAVHTLIDLQTLNNDQKLEIIQSLNLVMVQLRSLDSEKLKQVQGTPSSEVRAQIDSIRDSIEQSTDKAAREDLEKALMIAESRLEQSHETSPGIQRLAAQRVQLLQTLFRARDLLAQSRLPESQSLDTRELLGKLESLSSAYSEVVEVEQN